MKTGQDILLALVDNGECTILQVGWLLQVIFSERGWVIMREVALSRKIVCHCARCSTLDVPFVNVMPYM